MKKLIFKLLSVLISIYYALLAKSLFSDSSNLEKIHSKVSSMSKSLEFVGLDQLIISSSQQPNASKFNEYSLLISIWFTF